MPAPYGVTAAGFVRKTLDEAQAEVQDDLRGSFGAAILVNPESRFGQLAAIRAEREADLWEVLEGIYAAVFPDSSTDVHLDNVASLTGTLRQGATFSTVVATACGTPTTLLAAGRVFQVQDGGAKFDTLADATIAAVAAWAGATVYAEGDRRHNGGQVYEVVTGGTSAGAGGPTGTGQAIADNSVIWKWIGTGTGAVDVECEAQEEGAKPAPAGTLNVIVTAVAGLTTVRNLLDAEEGRELETDAALRSRRELELRKGGAAAVDPIRARLLQPVAEGGAGATQATVFHNTTMVTDGDGIPAKSVEALVTGGEDQDIRDALLATVAAGIQTHGGVSGTAEDDEGNIHTVKFSRPTTVDLWIELTVEVTDEFPADGVTQIKNAILDWWELQARAGKNVVPSQIMAQVHQVDGVDAVSVLEIDDVTPTVTTGTFLIGLRELAALDSSRITVTTAAAVP